MTRLVPLMAVLSSVGGCKSDPAQSTFVGNPTMRARIADTDEQQVISGELDALEVLLATCEQAAGGGGNVALGSMQLTFAGDTATEPIELEPGDHCGLWFVVHHFAFTYEEEGTETTLLVDNFDLYLDVPFEAVRDGSYEVRFGDDDWLTDLSLLLEPGTETVVYERDGSELAERFFDGLIEGSTVTKLTD